MGKLRAYTLLEMVLTLALMAILAGALGVGIAVVVRGYNVVSTRRQQLAQVQSGLNRMISEIRLIPASAQVVSTSASSFTFQYPAGTTITYTLNSNNLRRNEVNLIPNVSALAFTYYTEGGAVTTTPASVRGVQVQVTLAPIGSWPSFVARTQVFIPNTGHHYVNYTSP